MSLYKYLHIQIRLIQPNFYKQDFVNYKNLIQMLQKFHHKDPEDILYHPVTLALQKNQNKNYPRQLCNNNHNDSHEQQSDAYCANNDDNLFNIHSEDSQRALNLVEDAGESKGNGELIEELCELMGRNNVMGSMGKELYDRVERVLQAVQNSDASHHKYGNKPNNNRLALKQLPTLNNAVEKDATSISYLMKQNHTNNNNKKTLQKNVFDEPESDSNENDSNQPKMKNYIDFCPANTFSITRQLLPHQDKNKNEPPKTTHKSQSKDKKTPINIQHQPSLKQTKSTKLLTQQSINTKNNRTCSKKTENSKQKIYKVVLDKKQINSKQQKSAQKKQLMSRNPSSLSITAFTTRNKLNSKEKQKQRSKEKGRSSSKGNSYSNSKQSTGKISKFSTNSTKLKIMKNDGLRRICTDQDYERMMFAEDQEDQRLFTNTNKQRIKTYQSDAYPPSQFIENIALLQEGKNKQEHELQLMIKSLKQQIASEKLLLTNLEQSISAIKKEQHNFDINNTFILNKKKEIHKKLESVWNEVKLLNGSIMGVRENNEEILANVQEERQLVEMYNRVIEQIKMQLRIEIEEKDQLKRLLKQSKKNEQASRIKAHSTKQKTQLILDNLRESINKWMV